MDNKINNRKNRDVDPHNVADENNTGENAGKNNNNKGNNRDKNTGNAVNQSIYGQKSDERRESGDYAKVNPDNREDNVERIQRNIDFTIRNMELADEMIEKTDDEKTKKDLSEKNARRERALEGMRHEIKDEADAREAGNHTDRQ